MDIDTEFQRRTGGVKFGDKGGAAGFGSGAGGFGAGRRRDRESRGGRGRDFGGGGILGGGAGSKVIFGAIAMVAVRLYLSSKSNDRVKALPAKYYSRIPIWQAAKFGTLFDDQGQGTTDAIARLENMSTGAWNFSSRYKKRVLKPMAMLKGKNRTTLYEKTGSRLLAMPGFLTPDECDELIGLADSDVFADKGTDGPRAGAGWGWRAAPKAGQYSSPLLLQIEHKLFNLTGVPAHRHDIAAHVGTVTPSDTSFLRHDLGTDPSMIATFVVFLSPPEHGGEIIFPTFGRSDKTYRNLTYDLLAKNITDPWNMPSITAADGTEPTPTCKELHCRQHRVSMHAMKGCASLAKKKRVSKGVKAVRGGFGVPTKQGSAALWYSRLRDGLPDPDMWHMHCPQNTSSRVLVIHKRLPVVGVGPAATWDSEYDAVCETPQSCT